MPCYCDLVKQSQYGLDGVMYIYISRLCIYTYPGYVYIHIQVMLIGINDLSIYKWANLTLQTMYNVIHLDYCGAFACTHSLKKNILKNIKNIICKKISSIYEMPSLWNVLSMKFFFLWNVLSMKCLLYEMSFYEMSFTTPCQLFCDYKS